MASGQGSASLPIYTKNEQQTMSFYFDQLIWIKFSNRPHRSLMIKFELFSVHSARCYCYAPRQDDQFRGRFPVDQPTEILLGTESGRRPYDNHSSQLWLWVPGKHEQAGYNTSDRQMLQVYITTFISKWNWFNLISCKRFKFFLLE